MSDDEDPDGATVGGVDGDGPFCLIFSDDPEMKAACDGFFILTGDAADELPRIFIFNLGWLDSGVGLATFFGAKKPHWGQRDLSPSHS